MCFIHDQVTSTMLTPPGMKFQILMLAEGENEKGQWVHALNELHKAVKKNKIEDKSVTLPFSSTPACTGRYLLYITSSILMFLEIKQFQNTCII